MKQNKKDAAVLNTKIFFILLVVGFLAVGITFYFIAQKNSQKAPSNVSNMSPPEKTFNTPISKKYQKTLAANDQEESKIAEATGKSAVSTLIPGEEVSDNLPVQKRAEETHPNRPQPTPQTTNSLSDSQRQNATKMIASLMTQWKTPSMSLGSSVSMKEPSAEQQSTTKAPTSSQTSSEPITPQVLITKGTVCYAVLDSVINTDYKNVLISATLVNCNSGDNKFTGGKLLGTYGQNFDKVGVSFNTLKYSNDSYKISAVAIDEKTGQGILTGSVDRHIFARYVLPTLTSIATGWAKGAGTENTTITSNVNGTTSSQGTVSDQTKAIMAASEAGKTLNQVVKDNLHGREITVKIVPKPGKGIGVVFTADVTKK